MKINIKTVLATAVAVVSFSACSNYVDIDSPNPNAPESVPISGILTGGQLNFANDFAYSLYMNEVLQAYTHQMVIREEGGRYDVTTSNLPNSNSWDNFFSGTLKQLDAVIDAGTEEGNLKYVGIAKILKAHAFTRAVDVWGDIPFTEAGKGPSTFLNPKFDDDQAIYEACFDLIDQGIADLNATAPNLQVPGNDDIFYSGDMDSWKRFANTLKLHLYNQVRNTSLFNSSEVNSLLSGGQLINDVSQDFELDYSTTMSPADERNPLFRDEYGGGQITHYISPFLYEMQKGWNPNILTGIEDPRIPYYYVNQLAPGETPTNEGDYHDTASGFLSIRFGSTGPNVDKAQRDAGTMVGNYIAGGKFDDGLGGSLSVTSGTGHAPLRILTLYDRYFIEAELIQAGLVAGNAQTALQNAIDAAFAKVNQIASFSSISGISTTVRDQYKNAVIGQFSNASSNKKMEIIMTQKWIANFGNPLTSYSDYRRTGYPVWPDPNMTSGSEYMLPGLDDSETFISRGYPLSEFWPSTELSANSSAPAQKVPTTYKVFWDN